MLDYLLLSPEVWVLSLSECILSSALALLPLSGEPFELSFLESILSEMTFVTSNCLDSIVIFLSD